MATFEQELNQLIRSLKVDSTNNHLINSIAIGYYENPNLIVNREDLWYFELAYRTNRTVKSMHNLAWFLYFEHIDQKRAISIQEECVAMNPKSYYPYYLLGLMLMDSKAFKEALSYLNKAYEIKAIREIKHHLGYCYFQLHDLIKARDVLMENLENETTNHTRFNLGLISYKLGNFVLTKQLADKLLTSIHYHTMDDVSGYELGLLYFLLQDYSKATMCLLKQGINNINLLEWRSLSYAFYKTDKKGWEDEVKRVIQHKKEYIENLACEAEKLENSESKEIVAIINDTQDELDMYFTLLKQGVTLPHPNLESFCVMEGFKCLLFDCKTHKNLNDDI